MDTIYDVTRAPVTRRELDRLQRWLREPPHAELHCTPGGMTETVIKRLQREHDAIRASFIDGRLKQHEGRAANDFARAVVRGRAQHDFERSR